MIRTEIIAFDFDRHTFLFLAWLQMERKARAHASLRPCKVIAVSASLRPCKVETLMAANEALGQEATTRNEQLAKLEDAMARCGKIEERH
eukprot:1143817-Pelagomonas_calceolata.AAC.3